MFIELHLLQNFAPSNLNRDDTGSPKDCEFGGYRRARISSQSFKRAMRTEFREGGLLPDEALARRTKRIQEEVASRLHRDEGRDEEAAKAALRALLGAVKITFDGKTGKSQYLLYLGEREIARLAELTNQHWDTLVGVEQPAAVATGARGARQTKRAGSEAVGPEITRAVLEALSGGKAADLALFGRMVADRPDRNVDAASQVAHALSTHQASMEFDFYTAVDDLRPEDTEGADMLGTVEFNSACFYRYLNVDLDQLNRNLGGDETLARQTLEAFVRAAVTAIPSGKQNSMAAQNPPALVFAVARQRGLWSLANAFLKPIRASRDVDLMQGSIQALEKHWGQLLDMYGGSSVAGTWVAQLEEDGLTRLAAARQPNVEALVQGVLGTASFSAS